MIKFSKLSIHQFFPVISFICLAFLLYIERNWSAIDFPVNVHQLYFYFWIFYPGIYLFFTAYFLRIFMKIQLNRTVKKVLIGGLVALVIGYLAFTGHQFFNLGLGIPSSKLPARLIGFLFGVLLGIYCATGKTVEQN